MSIKGKNISLSSYDDIFGVQQSAGKDETVKEIALTELHPFENHPFFVKEDEDMDKTVESVKEYGILTPAIVRPRTKGGYEIVSGHRRHKAAELAGLSTIPCIIRNLDDDAATIIMVDSNLQRENIMPSERAWAYRMKLEAMKRKAGRPTKDNPRQIGTQLRSDEEMASEAKQSARTIQRFIRLTYLIPQLLDMVDDRKLAFNPAVELSFLSPEQQKDVIEAMEYAQCTPSLSQAQRIKKLSQSDEYSLERIEDIMSEEKKTELDHVTLKNDVLKKYFPKSYTPKQMEDTIVKLLEQWQKQKQKKREMSL
ncbi:MAG: ParB/RepB/Spo0J family partition protein [Lachnospiraceae bacterium]|nr:ParB/RepB/Spo0J family partition protein [Lachnospiraceae bacterium]